MRPQRLLPLLLLAGTLVPATAFAQRQRGPRTGQSGPSTRPPLTRNVTPGNPSTGNRTVTPGATRLPSQGPRTAQQRQADAARQAAREQAAREREIVRRHLTERRTRVRSRGSMFRNIAVDRNFKNEYVLMRDQDVTAFLDITDPQHPGFDPKRESDEPDLESIPVSRRAHILVVPNRAREHLTREIGNTITPSDVAETLQVMRSAEALAARLGIQNPKIFMNPESRVTVGYLHVHIIGERPAGRSYPPPLK